MKYAHVEDGKVISGPSRLPASHKNISGFHLLPPEELPNYGWLPADEVKPPLADYEAYGEPAASIGADRVVLTYPVLKTKTLDEIKGERAALLQSQAEAAIAVQYPPDVLEGMIDRALALSEMPSRTPAEQTERAEIVAAFDWMKQARQTGRDAVDIVRSAPDVRAVLAVEVLLPIPNRAK